MGIKVVQHQQSQQKMLARTRAAAKLLGSESLTAQKRAKICLALLSNSKSHVELEAFQSALVSLPVDERHYWIGTLYTLMLSDSVRRSQATYFTPPRVADAVVDMAMEAGFDLAEDDVLDPAAGGAAFLSTLAGRMASECFPAKQVAYRLNGIEIDKGLAFLSCHLISERLGEVLPREIIKTGDALKLKIPASYDLVIANPPYGRMLASEIDGTAWREVAHKGHVNKYALFTELCFRKTKPNGIVALVIPSSFRSGPLYDRMREFIRSKGEVLSIASIAGRDGVFIDVKQDVSVLIVRKGKAHRLSTKVRFPVIEPIPSTAKAISRALPIEPSDAWPLPTLDLKSVGGFTLADYGVSARAGYFVWNREPSRLVKKLGRKKGYPLIWAKNVRRNELCVPSGKCGKRTDFVTFDGESTAITRIPAAVMQRTTNDKQSRRLIVAVVDPNVHSKWGGFVTENHTIVLTAEKSRNLNLLVSLLNTAAVDQRYRRVSGTASVSVKLLRKLDLPSPEAFSKALRQAKGNAEIAAEKAYLAHQKKANA